jgi:hypothetical protein
MTSKADWKAIFTSIILYMKHDAVSTSSLSIGIEDEVQFV